MVLLHGPKQNVTRLPSQEPEVNQVAKGIPNSAVSSFPLAGGMRLSCAVLFSHLRSYPFTQENTRLQAVVTGESLWMGGNRSTAGADGRASTDRKASFEATREPSACAAPSGVQGVSMVCCLDSGIREARPGGFAATMPAATVMLLGVTNGTALSRLACPYTRTAVGKKQSSDTWPCTVRPTRRSFLKVKKFDRINFCDLFRIS